MVAVILRVKRETDENLSHKSNWPLRVARRRALAARAFMRRTSAAGNHASFKGSFRSLSTKFFLKEVLECAFPGQQGGSWKRVSQVNGSDRLGITAPKITLSP